MGADDRTRIQTERTSAGVGTQLSGIYELDARLASGGMGEVYRGHNIQTGDLVAIKIVLPEFAGDETILKLFRKEASVLNHLSHEAVVRYHVFTVDPGIGRPYLAMEYVDGELLVEVMRHGPMPVESVRRLCHRLASGLAAVHRAGAIHRDLSPDNIILPGGNVEKAKIIDFGIARSAKIGGGTLIGGQFAGKYNYVSPEQLGLFGGEVNERSDIYSLGLVLVAALRGKPLDMSGSQVDTVEKRRRVPDLSEVAGELRTLLSDMLQPDPADRPGSMAEVARRARAGSRSEAEDETEWPYEAISAGEEAPWLALDARRPSSRAPENVTAPGGDGGFVRHVRPALPADPQRPARPSALPSPARSVAPLWRRRLVLVLAGFAILVGGGALLAKSVVDSLVPRLAGPGPIAMKAETKPVVAQVRAPAAAPPGTNSRPLPATQAGTANKTPPAAAKTEAAAIAPSPGRASGRQLADAAQAAAAGGPSASGRQNDAGLPAIATQTAPPSQGLKSDDILKRLLAQTPAASSVVPAGSGAAQPQADAAGQAGAIAHTLPKLEFKPVSPPVPRQSASPAGTAATRPAGRADEANWHAPKSPVSQPRVVAEPSAKAATAPAGQDVGAPLQGAERMIVENTPAPAALPPPVLVPAPAKGPVPAPRTSKEAADGAARPVGLPAPAPAAAAPAGTGAMKLATAGPAAGTDSRPPPFDAAQAVAPAAVPAAEAPAREVARTPPQSSKPLPGGAPDVAAQESSGDTKLAMNVVKPNLSAPGRDPVAERTDWVRGFSGGSCFFASPAAITVDAARVEGLGSAVEPFVRLMDGFKKKFGVEPDIQVGMIARSQCPVPLFLQGLPGSGAPGPKLTLDDTSIPDGGKLSGALEVRGGPYVSLLLIDHDGMTFSLDHALTVKGERATFDIPIKLDARENVAGKPKPEILVAIEGDKEIAATSLPRPVSASEALPRILSEIRRSGARFSATAKYFQLGG